MGLTTRNGTWLREKIEEMENQLVETITPKFKISSKVVRKVKASRDVIEHDGPMREGKTWWIIFESEFSRFYLEDMGVDWGNFLPLLTSLPGSASSVARYCLSHNYVAGEKIKDILLSLGQPSPVGLEGDDKTRCIDSLKKAVREVYLHASELAQMGIRVEGGCVFYKKDELLPGPFFVSPEPTEPPEPLGISAPADKP